MSEPVEVLRWCSFPALHVAGFEGPPKIFIPGNGLPPAEATRYPAKSVGQGGRAEAGNARPPTGGSPTVVLEISGRVARVPAARAGGICAGDG